MKFLLYVKPIAAAGRHFKSGDTIKRQNQSFQMSKIFVSYLHPSICSQQALFGPLSSDTLPWTGPLMLSLWIEAMSADICYPV